MLLERSRILDNANAKSTVSGMRRIKSTSSNFRKRKPFFGSSHYFGREIIFKHKMFSRKREKSSLSSDATDKSARPRHSNFDRQRARTIEMERMFQTYPVLNKKKILLFYHRSLSCKSWVDLRDVGFS